MDPNPAAYPMVAIKYSKSLLNNSLCWFDLFFIDILDLINYNS